MKITTSTAVLQKLAYSDAAIVVNIPIEKASEETSDDAQIEVNPKE